MKDQQETIRMIEEKLDAILACRLLAPTLSEDDAPPELRGIVQRINTLARDITEMVNFGQDLARGQLDTVGASRSNYLASPLKEIHSQLQTASYNMEQLIKGNMVSKLNLPGDFFAWYNLLIEKVSQTFSMIRPDEQEWGDNATSWRYHQILTAINKLSIMVLEVDAAGNIMFANPNARSTFSDISRLPYEDSSGASELTKYLCTFANRISKIDPGKLVFEDFPVLFELYDEDKERWYKITSDVINLADGSVGLLHVIDDISDWKKQEHQLTLSATIDPMTAAYTRNAGMRKLGEAIRMREEMKSCVAFVDIDGLKTINDQYGHNEGDYVITTTAEILISSVRETDWVIRYGGDEFLVLLLNSTREAAQKAVDRMYQKLASINLRAMKPYALSFSIGLSPIRTEMRQAQDVIAAVDEDMYQKKMAKKAAEAEE